MDILPPISLSNSYTCLVIHAASCRYLAYHRIQIPDTGWYLRKLSYQRAMFSDRPRAIWLLIASLPLSYSILIGQSGLSQSRVTSGRRPVSCRKLVCSLGNRTVPFVRARTAVSLPSSHMKYTYGIVWGKLPPSLMTFSTRILYIRCCSCLCSGTHLRCQPLPGPALCMCQLLRKLALLPWIPLVTLRLHFFHVVCTHPRIRFFYCIITIFLSKYQHL